MWESSNKNIPHKCEGFLNSIHRQLSYTANSIKVVLVKAQTVNFECARDDGLSLIFPSNLGLFL